MKKFAAAFIGFFLSLALSFSAYGLTDRQRDVLQLAYDAGKPYDLQQALMGIVFQESMAGVMHPVGDVVNGCGRRSYGVAQVQVAAAYDALRACPDLDNGFRVEEEIIAKLLTDDEWAVNVAACYLYWIKRQGLSWYDTIAAYNRGVSGVRNGQYNPHYVRSVIDHIRSGKVHQFMTETGQE